MIKRRTLLVPLEVTKGPCKSVEWLIWKELRRKLLPHGSRRWVQLSKTTVIYRRGTYPTLEGPVGGSDV